MVLRTLLGGPGPLTPRATLRPPQVVLAGVRALDPAEKQYIADHDIAVVPPGELADLPSVVAAAGARAVYIHIDLDVLDPSGFSSVGCPEPGGLAPAELASAVRALTDRFPLAGLGLTEYEPAGDHDRDTLRTLVEALFAPTARR